MVKFPDFKDTILIADLYLKCIYSCKTFIIIIIIIITIIIIIIIIIIHIYPTLAVNVLI